MKNDINAKDKTFDLNTNQLSLKDSLIPILIGVTGHRDISSETYVLLKDCIKDLLLKLQAKYKNSPIVLVTSLADGSDRAAAEATIELNREGKGINLGFIVSLPMEETLYKQTFYQESNTTINPYDEYERIKREAIGVFQVPQIIPEYLLGADQLEINKYINLGAYLACNTQIMIAAWDGSEEEDKGETIVKKPIVYDGGTYNTLRMRLFGLEDEKLSYCNYEPNEEKEFTYWIDIPKSNEVWSKKEVFWREYTHPVNEDGTIKAVKNNFNTFRHLHTHSPFGSDDILEVNDNLAQIEYYNKKLKDNYDRIKEGIQESMDYFPKKPESSPEWRLFQKYAAADRLSLLCQRARKKWIISNILLAAIAAISLNLYTGKANEWGYVAAYLILFLLSFAIYNFKVKPSKFHDLYYQLRGIAEGIRIQYFTNYTGTSFCVKNEYPNKKRGTNRWMLNAIKNSEILFNAEEQYDLSEYDANIKLERLGTVLATWIVDQKMYFEKKNPIVNNNYMLSNFAMRFLIVLGLILTFLIILMDFRSLMIGKDINDAIPNFLAGIIPIALFIVNVWNNMFAYKKLSENYSWMKKVYELASIKGKLILANKDATITEKILQMQLLLYKVAKEALLENSEWHNIFEEREPKATKA